MNPALLRSAATLIFLGVLVAGCRGEEAKALPGDAPEQVRQDARACDRGEMTACNNLAASYEYGDGVVADLARAARLYEQSCEAGALLGCTNLASMLREGRGMEVDVARALELYDDTCSLGEPLACLRAGDLIREDRPSGVDPERAWVFYRRACDSDISAGCVELGWRALNADPVDYHVAASHFGLACERGLMIGCAGMGFVILDGEAIGRRDVQQAANYLERGCLDGHRRSCERLVELYEEGLDVIEADPEEAAFFAERAAELSSD